MGMGPLASSCVNSVMIVLYRMGQEFGTSDIRTEMTTANTR